MIGILLMVIFFSSCGTQAENGSLSATATTAGETEYDIQEIDVPQGSAHSAMYEIVLKDTVYGELSADTSNLPVETLENALTTYHIDPSTKPGSFVTNITGCYYSLDLSEVIPLYCTEDERLICKLRKDRKTKLLIVLDSAISPSKAQYYFSNEWDMSNESVSFLLDGEKPTRQERRLCKNLFRVHLDHDDLENFFVLDGDPEVHTITVIFNRLKGLAYKFHYYEYVEYTGYVVETAPDGKTVLVE